MHARMAIGFGASTRAAAGDIVALIRTLLVQQSLSDALVATVQGRNALGRDVAEALCCELVLARPDALAATAHSLGLRASPLALARVGSPSVAEAAALYALGPRARLTIERRTGRLCTVAVAELG